MRTRHSPLAHRLFDIAFLPWMRRRVRGPVLSGLPHDVPADVPLLLVANHASWWDGFLLRDVQRNVRPGAALFTVMLESELRQRPFFRLMGVIGLEPGSTASLRRLLHFLREQREKHGDAVFAFFPQGRIRPTSARPLGFRPGVAAVARAVAPVAVLPVAIHFEMLEHTAPTAFLCCGPIHTSLDGSLDVDALACSVANQLDAIRRQLEEETWEKS